MTDEFRKKSDNFLYYHKRGLIACCLAAALLLSGICSYGKEDAEPMLYGVVLNLSVSEEAIEQICCEGVKALGKNPEEDRIMIETGLNIDVENPEANAMNGVLEKMTSQIFSHELDFIIGPEEVVKYYAELGGLYELNQSNQTDIYGVDISHTIQSSGDEKILFCILKNSEHKRETRIFLESLLEEP